MKNREQFPPEESQPEQSEKGGKYRKTYGYFEAFSKQFSGQMQEAQTAGDKGALKGLEKAKKEVDSILGALEIGDTIPAKEKLVSMAEQQHKILTKEILPEDARERIETLQEITGYLSELSGVEGKNT